MTSWRSLFGPPVSIVKKDGKLLMVVRSRERNPRSKGSSSTKKSWPRKQGSFTIDAYGNASVVTSDHLKDDTTASKRDSLESK